MRSAQKCNAALGLLAAVADAALLPPTIFSPSLVRRKAPRALSPLPTRWSAVRPSSPVTLILCTAGIDGKWRKRVGCLDSRNEGV